jgi:hypothetical protein
VDFPTGTFTPLVAGEIYEIDPATGHATPVAPTLTTLSAIVVLHDTVYGFNGITGEVVTLDPMTGATTTVSILKEEAAVIAGAAPLHPAPASAR